MRQDSASIKTVNDEVKHPDIDQIPLERIFAALAEPARLATVRALAAVGETTCIQVTREAELSVSRSTMSHHLRILREAGLIRERAHGAAKMVTLREDELERRHPGLLDVVRRAPGRESPDSMDRLASTPRRQHGRARPPRRS
jgi:DNA-binding transcriptional ArsR family regulator